MTAPLKGLFIAILHKLNYMGSKPQLHGGKADQNAFCNGVAGGQMTRTRNLRVTSQRIKPIGHAAL